MIVPIIFESEEYTKEKPSYLWVFYKFSSFSLKANTPIIATNEYFEKPSYYKNKNHSAVNVMDYYGINDETFKKLKYYSLKKTKITQKYKDNLECWTTLLKKRDKDLEEEIEKAIVFLEKKYEKIEAFMIWTWLPSISYIAKKHNIKVINQEGSAIRQPFYSRLLNYFQFQNKFDCSNILTYYQNLTKNKDLLYLTRKELLALLVDKKNIKYINELDHQPTYEIGYGLGLNTDCFATVYSKINQNDILKKLSTLVPKDKICIRPHPKDPIDVEKLGFTEDKSPSAFSWILNCKRIVSDLSNTGFEALLLGRTVISLSDKMPAAFLETTNLSYLEDEVAGIRKVNFLTFAWFTPEELTQDVSYVKWRLTNPNIREIYIRNLDYILKDNNMSYDEMKNIMPKDRLNYILSKRDIDIDIDSLSIDQSNQQETKKNSFLHMFRRRK